MDSRTTIAAAMIVKNEAQFLQGCLDSIKFCDEIVIVVDKSSEDETERIARESGARVFVRELDSFASQRNFSLDQVTSDWILIIDADERITKELRDEIIQSVNSATIWGYEIGMKPYVFGLEVEHSGWSPSYNLRLFKSNGRYTGDVHEKIQPLGDMKKLKELIVHYNYIDVVQYIKKLNQYTSFEANVMLKSGKCFKKSMLVTKPIREFAYRIIKVQGWRDGFIGFNIACLMAFYRFTVILKFWELSRGFDALDTYHEIDSQLLKKAAE